MGVKDLWQVLQPVCERKSLWELQDKIIAVDLSCWVCDSQNVGEYSSQPNMYLRNLFFRTSVLLLLGATPIFVLEGSAPELKAAVMEQRVIARGFSQSQKEGTQKPVKRDRRQLKSIQKKCCELLKCLGVKFIQSEGEAEALCAILNKNGLVAGCISQDSDCFLYGAPAVYRNFTITAGNSSTGGPGFSIDLYSMAVVEERLGLSRNKLIALSLLCGCDYLQNGVAGVGKESAFKFVSSVSDKAILDRLREWRANDYYEQLELERTVGGCEECGHIGRKRLHSKEGCKECKLPKGCTPSFNPQSLCQMEPEQRKILTLELTIRKKALLDPDFPSEEIIDEFLRPNITVPSKLDTKWEQPDILGFLRLAVRFLNWEELYAFNKFLPILTRWVVLQMGNKKDSCPIYPEEIKKARVLRGIPSYEIKWADRTDLFDTILKTMQDSENEDDSMFCTIEPKSLIEKAYPDLVDKYTTQKEEAKKAKRKGKSKTTKKKDQSEDAGKKRCEICDYTDRCLCNFTQRDPNNKISKEKKVRKRLKPKDVALSKQTRLSPFIQKSVIEKPTSISTVEEDFNLSLRLENEEEWNEADLSAIVMGIVGEKAYFEELSPGSRPGSRSGSRSGSRPGSRPGSPESVGLSQTDEVPCPSASSDDEFEIRIPLIERIKMKAVSSNELSPAVKRPRRSNNHPYSPLSGQLSLNDSPTIAKQSIIKSNAARRFSASFQAFAGIKTTPLESSIKSHSDSRFNLNFTEFLDCDDE